MGKEKRKRGIDGHFEYYIFMAKERVKDYYYSLVDFLSVCLKGNKDSL